MKILFTALDALQKIVNDKKSFSSAVKEACKGKVSEAARKDVTTVVGCALRHYLILEHRFLEVLKDENQYVLPCILATSNTLFAKKVSDGETEKFLRESIEKEDTLNNVLDLYHAFKDGEPLINKDLDPNCLEFLSYRYNTPFWIVRMWRKHYGYKDMRRILMANSKHFNNYGRINNEYIDEEKFERENKTFQKTQFDKFYLYTEKGKVKSSFQYLNKLVYVYPIVFDEIIKESDADSFRGIAAFANTPNALVSALSANLTSYFEMDFLIGKQQAYFETKQEKNLYNAKNVHLYEGPSSSGITCFSKKVHTFFVLPDSSKFFLLRNTPDYFIHFDQNSLDGLIQEQLQALEDSAEFVEDGGYLVYYVATNSEKENHGIIEKFLENHKEFSLQNEKRIFSFSEYDSTCYYAILRKAEK